MASPAPVLPKLYNFETSETPHAMRAPTGGFVTLTEDEADRLNRGEENRDDGCEPITLERYKAGDEYFRVRKPPPQGGVPRDELFDYDYFDPSELWRAARWNRKNPVNRQPIHRRRDKWWQLRERFEDKETIFLRTRRPTTQYELEAMVRDQVERQEELEQDRERRRLRMTHEQYDAFLERRQQARQERRQQRIREREEAERRLQEWNEGGEARMARERQLRDEWRRQVGLVVIASDDAARSDGDANGD